jgi:hypothetical protein
MGATSVPTVCIMGGITQPTENYSLAFGLVRHAEFCKSKDDFYTYSYMFETRHHTLFLTFLFLILKLFMVQPYNNYNCPL